MASAGTGLPDERAPTLLICALDLTCYYYVFCVALAPLLRVRQELGPAYLALAGSSQVLLGRFYFIDDRYVAESWLYCAFAACVLYALSRPFSVARLRAAFSSRHLPLIR